MPDIFGNALAYENVMGRWSARLAPLFASFAQVPDGGRLLDVGCGTGSLVAALAGLTRRSEIVGIDPAEPFVQYARTRFTDARISFDRGDAMALPYPDRSFAAVLSLLVLQFVPRLEQAMDEMRRVTGPGGTVAACTWDRDRLEWGAAFWAEAVKLDPEAVPWSQHQRVLDRPGQLAALWEASGLERVEERGLEISMEFASFDDYWQPLLTGVGSLGTYLVRLPPARQEALGQALRSRFLGGGPDRMFTLRAQALAVRGVVAQH